VGRLLKRAGQVRKVERGKKGLNKIREFCGALNAKSVSVTFNYVWCGLFGDQCEIPESCLNFK